MPDLQVEIDNIPRNVSQEIDKPQVSKTVNKSKTTPRQNLLKRWGMEHAEVTLSDIANAAPEMSKGNEKKRHDTPSAPSRPKTEPPSSNIVQKDARELLYQLSEHGYRVEAQKIIDEVGYDETKVREMLHELAEKNPGEYSYFVRSLRGNSFGGDVAVLEREKRVKEAVESTKSSHPEDINYQTRREAIQKKCIVLGKKIPENLKIEIDRAFPSGNYLAHGTSVQGALGVVEDQALRSVGDKRKDQPGFKSKGGVAGISFSYDGVGALPGTPRHMVMFLTSPEMALTEGTKLTIPFRAANNELQLVDQSYDRQRIAQSEAQYDFLIDGASDDFFFLERALERGEDSQMLQDLQKIKTGELQIEEIREKYRIEDEKIIVNPDIIEGDISQGIVWSDYLLQHTEAGKLLGKNIADCSIEELIELHNASQETTNQQLKALRVFNDSLNHNSEVSVPLSSTVMMVPRQDMEMWIDICARLRADPKTIVAFSTTEGPRVPNWRQPEGHHQKAREAIEDFLSDCGAPKPSLPFSSLLGKETSEGDIAGQGIKYLRWKAIEDAKEISKQPNGDLVAA